MYMAQLQMTVWGKRFTEKGNMKVHQFVHMKSNELLMIH